MKTESLTYEIAATKTKKLLLCGKKLQQAAKMKKNPVTANTEITALETDLVTLDVKSNHTNSIISILEQKLADSEYKLDEALASCHQLRADLDEEKLLHKESITIGMEFKTKYDQLQKQHDATIKQISKK